MKCMRCGVENANSAKFCSSCGASLSKVSAGGPEPLEYGGSFLDQMSRYIPPSLAEKIRHQGEQKVSERRHVTVLFADISGFTAMSEALDPEVVRGVLNSCFKELVEVVFKYEGTIDKFIGDEIMALFGVPIAHENDPERALRAAVEMRERLQRFSANLQVPLPKPLTIHVGINTGEVIAGNVGSDLRMDYSVMGDTVNLAARLVSAAGQDQIFVSDKTYALTRYMIEYKPLRPFRVQGKKRKVQAYEVIGIRAMPDRKYGVQAAYGPLADREEEVAFLRTQVQAVRQGQGKVIGLSGEAGTGKSRLVYELQRIAEDFIIVPSSAVSYETPPVYLVFGDLLRKLFGLEIDEQEGVIRQKMEAWVIARGLTADLLPHLGSLLGLRDEALIYRTDEERFAGVRKALDGVLRSLSSEQPLLLILEDLQWTDHLSRRLLDEIVRETGSFRMLLCCVYRPEFRHEWEGSPSFDSLPVRPLSNEKTRELSNTLLKFDIPPELNQLIVERTEGNPFFVEEMIKALIDEGVIDKTRTGFRIAKDISEARLPNTIQGVIMSRIDRLEAQALDTLRYAAVIGRSFSQALLESVSPRGAIVKAHLEKLQDLELVFQQSISPELEYIFKHFVTREVIYNSILVKRRKVIHLEVAKAMERNYSERLADYYEALANHFEAGEDWKKAAEYYGLAGSRTRELYADEGARILLERKERAIQKVFEQKEGVPWARYLLAGILFFLVSSTVFQILGGGISFQPYQIAYSLVFAMLPLLRGIMLFTRSEVARSATIYSDHISIRGTKRNVQIPFGVIRHVRWVCRRKWSDLFHWIDFLGLSTWNWQYFYGTFRFREGSRYTYFNLAHALMIRHSGEKPILLNTLNAGVLYQELKLAISKWAVLHNTGASAAFQGSPSRLEEQHTLLIRSEAGSMGAPITYDRVIQKVEKGEAESSDEIGVKGPQDTSASWARLDRAGREDSRLWASFHPVRYSMKAFLKSPFLWIPIMFLLLLTSLTLLPGGIKPGEVAAVAASSSIGTLRVIPGISTVGIILAFASVVWIGFLSTVLFPVYLVRGFFALFKRRRFTKWLNSGLRILSVCIAVLIFFIGFIIWVFLSELIFFPNALKIFGQ
jgi:class 3 adenylate cyclase